jgi:hypothetical protein
MFFSHRSKTKICSQKKIQKTFSTTFETTPEKINVSNQIKSIQQNFKENDQNVFQLKNNFKIFNSSKLDQMKIFSANLSKQKHFLTILFQQFSVEIILQNQKIFFFSFTNLFKTFCIFILLIFNQKILSLLNIRSKHFFFSNHQQYTFFYVNISLK